MKNNERKIGALLSYISISLNTLINLMYVPLLLYFLGIEEYGLYQLIGSVIVYIAIMDLGLSGTTTRFYSKYIALEDQKNKENVLAISSILYIVITLIICSVGILLYFFLDDIFGSSLTQSELLSAKHIYIILLINIAISIPANVFTSIISSNEKFVFLKSLTLIQIIIQPFLIIGILTIEASALNLVLVQAAVNIAAILIRVFYCFKILKVKVKLHSWDKGLLKEMTAFSFFIFLTALLDQIFWKSDQLILGIVAGTASVAIYSIATQIISNYMYLSTVMSGLFLPFITKKVAKEASNKELTEIFIRIGRLQYLLLLCILSGFLLFGKEFIGLWVGEEYYTAYYIALIIMVPFTIDLIQNIGLTILQAKNLYAFRAKVFLFIAVLNIIASIPLAIYFGPIGCAIASAISYFIGNAIIMNIYYHKKVGIDIIAFWKEIFSISVPLFSMIFIGIWLNLMNLGGIYFSFILKISLFSSLFLIISWKFSMNNYEKNLLKKLFNKKLIKNYI